MDALERDDCTIPARCLDAQPKCAESVLTSLISRCSKGSSVKSMRPSEVMYSSTSESKTDVLTAKPFRGTVVDAMSSNCHEFFRQKGKSYMLILQSEAFMYTPTGNKGTSSSASRGTDSLSAMLQ